MSLPPVPMPRTSGETMHLVLCALHGPPHEQIPLTKGKLSRPGHRGPGLDDGGGGRI